MIDGDLKTIGRSDCAVCEQNFVQIVPSTIDRPDRKSISYVQESLVRGHANFHTNSKGPRADLAAGQSFSRHAWGRNRRLLLSETMAVSSSWHVTVNTLTQSTLCFLMAASAYDPVGKSVLTVQYA